MGTDQHADAQEAHDRRDPKSLSQGNDRYGKGKNNDEVLQYDEFVHGSYLIANDSILLGERQE